MNRRLLMTVLSASCLMAVVFLARGFDVQLGWHANDAQAIDLFGSKEEAPAAQPDTKPFWSESSGGSALGGPIGTVGRPATTGTGDRRQRCEFAS